MTAPKTLFFLFLLGILLIVAFFQNQAPFLSVKRALFDSYERLSTLRVSIEQLLRPVFKPEKSERIATISEKDTLQDFLETYDTVYKREFEDLLSSIENLSQLKILGLYPVVFLIRTRGNGAKETWTMYSETRIPVNAFVISPKEHVLVGRVREINGHEVTVIPFWNEDFSAQVRIHSREGTVYDLAYLENGFVLNFNPSFPFFEGDEVYVSDYEPGGYSLQRYGWDKIGTVGVLMNQDIVEYYDMRFSHTQDRFSEERYFLIIS
jgi:hypothetical protein